MQYCIDKSYFELTTLNYRLKAFNFGYTEIGDRPAPIVEVHRLRQSASQMWLLASLC